MKVENRMLQEAQALLDANRDIVARKEQEILSIGCSWCTNCSGIVGG